MWMVWQKLQEVATDLRVWRELIKGLFSQLVMKRQKTQAVKNSCVLSSSSWADG